MDAMETLALMLQKLDDENIKVIEETRQVFTNVCLQ